MLVYQRVPSTATIPSWSGWAVSKMVASWQAYPMPPQSLWHVHTATTTEKPMWSRLSSQVCGWHPQLGKADIFNLAAPPQVCRNEIPKKYHPIPIKIHEQIPELMNFLKLDASTCLLHWKIINIHENPVQSIKFPSKSHYNPNKIGVQLPGLSLLQLLWRGLCGLRNGFGTCISTPEVRRWGGVFQGFFWGFTINK